jgi:hypothetical protein
MCAQRTARSESRGNGTCPGQALEQDAAERVDVRACVDVVALDLLRRDVVDSADHSRCAGSGDALTRALRQSEVGQVRVFCIALPADQDVGGLDVPVDQPSRVRGVERVGDLAEQSHRPGGAERALLAEQPFQVALLDVAHRDVEGPVRLAGVVHGQDVRMLERGRDLGLREEAAPEALVVREVRSNHLQGDLAPQSQVGRAVDSAHPALAGELLDAVAVELGSDPKLFRDGHAALLSAPCRR